MSFNTPQPSLASDHGAVAVLTSGGIDSLVLVCDLARAGIRVHPLFIRGGLLWEPEEREAILRFLAAPSVQGSGRIEPLIELELPVADLLRNHWSTGEAPVPDADSPDEAVFLPGRNALLLTKAFLWCHLHQVSWLALAVLKGNPFPDATETFFERFESLHNSILGGEVRILRPYRALCKADVMARGREWPMELSFSCIRPVGGLHCGACNKCAERRRGFGAAGLPDRTRYAARELEPGGN